jgi:ABC-type antimicrobial peptide transport system permease subunit
MIKKTRKALIITLIIIITSSINSFPQTTEKSNLPWLVKGKFNRVYSIKSDKVFKFVDNWLSSDPVYGSATAPGKFC